MRKTSLFWGRLVDSLGRLVDLGKLVELCRLQLSGGMCGRLEGYVMEWQCVVDRFTAVG